MNSAVRILTIDLEEWFHILDNDLTACERTWKNFPSRIEGQMINLLDLFDSHATRGTFFVLGYIARKFPDLVKEIRERGHEIATHGDMHQLVYQQTPYEFEVDLDSAITSIFDACGENVNAYRAPGFSVTQNTMWVFDILAKYEIKFDCSIFPATRSHGGIRGFKHTAPFRLTTKSGANLKCFPMSVFETGVGAIPYSGGGYFRLLPKPVLSYIMNKRDYVMTYFHPRDFDADQPMVPGLNHVRRFKSYYGLGGAFKKLDHLLADFDFITLSEAESCIDWGGTDIVTIS